MVQYSYNISFRARIRAGFGGPGPGVHELDVPFCHAVCSMSSNYYHAHLELRYITYAP